MSAGRWRVKRIPRDICRWWVVTGPNDRRATFSTLPEAHTWAMLMARTVEVELPKVSPFLQAADFRVTSGAAWTEFRGESSNDLVSIPSYDRHRVALHLLALHYHHERNQK